MMYRTDVNVHARPSNRYSVSVFGAVGHCLKKKILWQFSHHTKEDEYQRFVRHMASEVRSDIAVKPVLLYDGYAPHSTDKSKAEMNRYFYPLQNVAHSSDFNSIVSTPAPCCSSYAQIVV